MFSQLLLRFPFACVSRLVVLVFLRSSHQLCQVFRNFMLRLLHNLHRNTTVRVDWFDLVQVHRYTSFDAFRTCGCSE